MKRFLRENGRMLAVTLFALIAGVCIGICVGMKLESQQQGRASYTENMCIDARTCMTRIVHFESCGHEQAITMDANAYIGYSAEDLSRLYANACISAFSRWTVCLHEQKAGYCPQHYILRAHSRGGFKVLRADEEYFTEELVLLLPDETPHLDPYQRSQLQLGVAFISLPEIDAYLESLCS